MREKTDLDLQPNQEEEPIFKSSWKQSNQEEQIPNSLSLLSNQSETLRQTDILSCRPTIAATLFDKNEQLKNKPSKPRFQSIDDLLNGT